MKLVKTKSSISLEEYLNSLANDISVLKKTEGAHLPRSAFDLGFMTGLETVYENLKEMLTDE